MASFADVKKKVAFDRISSSDAAQAVVSLPSNGKKAAIRPMKVKEQKDFLKAFEKQDEFLINEAFDRILSACVETIDGNPYDGDSICVQDRTFLLIKIRQLTSGDKLKIAHVIRNGEDEKDNKIEQVEIDLTTLKVVTHEGAIEKEVQISENVKVVLGPVTRKTEKEMESWLKKKGVKDSIIDRRYAAYAAFIKEIQIIPEGKSDFEEAAATLDQLIDFITDVCTEKDLKKFDEYAKTLDFGIKLVHPISSEDGKYNNENEELSLLSFFIM